MISPFWQEHAKTITLDNFRADGPFIGEQNGYNYEAVYTWCVATDPSLLADMHEDGAFGCVTRTMGDGKVVSRDLLDSLLEIRFLLNAELTRPGLCARILDVGAGYGRLAHRFFEVAPHVRVECCDPVLISRTCCAKYLIFRGVSQVQLDRPTLAVNIYSWAECTRAAISEGLDYIDQRDIQTLCVVPHNDKFTCYDGEFGSLLNERWLQADHEIAPVEQYATAPRSNYYLFERRQ